MLIPNSFSSYKLSEQEILAGSILSPLQQMCIQNQISALAEEKLSLQFTPNDVNQFLQKEAELQGQINALKYLITLSENAKTSASSPSVSTNSQEN